MLDPCLFRSLGFSCLLDPATAATESSAFSILTALSSLDQCVRECRSQPTRVYGVVMEPICSTQEELGVKKIFPALFSH